MATNTPDNHVLSSKLATPAPVPPPPAGPAPSAEYPKALYHKDSTADGLIVQIVASAAAAAALGDEWMSLAELKLETAPAQKEP